MIDFNDVSSLWFVLLDTSLKSAAVLGVALMAVTAMRRSSAAARHAVWVLATTSVLFMPVLLIVSPSLSVLPGWMSLERSVTPPIEVFEPVEQVATSVPVFEINVIQPSISTGVQVDETPVSPVVQPHKASLDWRGVAMRVWFFGVLTALLPLVLGHLSLWRLGRHAQRIEDGPWVTLLEQMRRQLQFDRPVVLFRSSQGAMPMTWACFVRGFFCLLKVTHEMRSVSVLCCYMNLHTSNVTIV